MPRLVIFDLDGTLVDSRQDLAASANAMLAEFGALPLDVETVAGMVGDGARELVARALSARGIAAALPSALERFLAIYSTRLLDQTRLYPGIAEALSQISVMASLALLTNKPENLSRAILEGLGIAAFFPQVIGGDSGHPRKPDPAGLIALTAAAGSTLAEVVYVGDSMVDVQTARAAGVRVVAAQYGFGHLREPLLLRSGEVAAASASEIPVLVSRMLKP